MKGPIRRVVLVHGAGHGAWCWEEVVPRLRRLGYDAAAIDLPGLGADTTPAKEATFERTVERVVQALRDRSEPCLLVGHSAGGASISQAAERCPEAVAKLVYVAASLPRNGEPMGVLMELAAKAGTPSALELRVPCDSEGAHGFDLDRAATFFYNTCDAKTAKRAVARLRPQPDAALAVASFSLTPERFGSIPKAYIVCTEDRALPPSVQHHLCDRSPGVTKHVMECDHSPFYSDPDGLVAILDREARALGA